MMIKREREERAGRDRDRDREVGMRRYREKGKTAMKTDKQESGPEGRQKHDHNSNQHVCKASVMKIVVETGLRR